MPQNPEGWNTDEFVTAVGVILFSSLLMYALAETLLINPLERNRRQFQFYTGEARARRDRATAAAAAAAAEEAQLLGAAHESDGDMADCLDQLPGDADSGSDVSDNGDGIDSGDANSMVRQLDKQRRQIETLEAVNDQLCAENERLEAKIMAISQIAAKI